MCVYWPSTTVYRSANARVCRRRWPDNLSVYGRIRQWRCGVLLEAWSTCCHVSIITVRLLCSGAHVTHYLWSFVSDTYVPFRNIYWPNIVKAQFNSSLHLTHNHLFFIYRELELANTARDIFKRDFIADANDANEDNLRSNSERNPCET